MHTNSLFTLLGERLMLHSNTLSITTYNTLYEVKQIVLFWMLIGQYSIIIVLKCTI